MAYLFGSYISSCRLGSLFLWGLAVSMMTPANATIIVSTGVDNTGTDNVLFNIGGLANDAFTVQGVANNAANTLIDFTGLETLHGNGGQARVEGFGGATYTFLSVDLNSGSTFTKLVWNLNTSTGTGTVIFTIDGVPYDGPDAGTATDVFNLANGQNFFTITATGGSTLSNVAYTTTGVEILDTRQIRIGGIAEGVPPGPEIPEPATYLMMGLGLAGLALLRRQVWKS